MDDVKLKNIKDNIERIVGQAAERAEEAAANAKQAADDYIEKTAERAEAAKEKVEEKAEAAAEKIDDFCEGVEIGTDADEEASAEDTSTTEESEPADGDAEEPVNDTVSDDEVEAKYEEVNVPDEAESGETEEDTFNVECTILEDDGVAPEPSRFEIPVDEIVDGISEVGAKIKAGLLEHGIDTDVLVNKLAEDAIVIAGGVIKIAKVGASKAADTLEDAAITLRSKAED